jgi:hypothetical protein
MTQAGSLTNLPHALDLITRRSRVQIHLALVQDEAHERGGATVAIRATDKAFATLTLASRAALAERGTAPSALVRKLRLPR